MTISTTLLESFQSRQDETLLELENLFRATIRPLPKLTVSEWADDHRYLSREDSAEPGKWRTSRAEYLRDIMNADNDPAVFEVVVMKGSQIGWTTALGNVIGFHVHHDPAPMLMLLPTIADGKDWSRDRFAPMIRDTPVLRGSIKDAKSRDSGNTVQHKTFAGGYIVIIGSNAPSPIRSRPIRIVFGDEIDAYAVSAGTEGNPLKLAEKRQTNWWNRKLWKGSTPLLKGTSQIEKDYERSDKREFRVPCPHCGGRQKLKWANVKWDKVDGEHSAASAHYMCEHCGTLWTDAERWSAVDRGEWVATAPFNGVAGFHLSQIYSPWVKLSSMVQEFLDARGSPNDLQVFVNTVLGETWEEQGETVDETGLRTNVENYDMAELPDGVHYASAGVDVQDDRLEVEIVGWGEADESWGIRYEIIYGDPAQKKVWEELDEMLFDRYWTEEGRLVRVRATCIDTGGHHGAAVFSYCASRFKRNVYPIKGASGPRPIWPKRASKSKLKDKLWIVGVDTAKDSVYGRFKIADPGPGYCHLPNTYDDEWFVQVTAETVVTRYREGRPYRVWVLPGGKRNEALDCRVYALAARMSLSKRQTRPSTITTEKVDAPVPDKTEDKPKRGFVKKAIGSRGGFVGGWK